MISAAHSRACARRRLETQIGRSKPPAANGPQRRIPGRRNGARRVEHRHADDAVPRVRPGDRRAPLVRHHEIDVGCSYCVAPFGKNGRRRSRACRRMPSARPPRRAASRRGEASARPARVDRRRRRCRCGRHLRGAPERTRSRRCPSATARCHVAEGSGADPSSPRVPETSRSVPARRGCSPRSKSPSRKSRSPVADHTDPARRSSSRRWRASPPPEVDRRAARRSEPDALRRQRETSFHPRS